MFDRDSILSRCRRDGSGCWIWLGRADHGGYGKLRRREGDRRVEYVAHRVSWEVFRGPIPAEMCVLHRCDRPACVNPEHLFLGTRKDNAHDMLSKGRARGAGTPWLGADVAAEIRSSDLTHAELAARYGVTRTTISRVRRGVTYAS